MPSRNPRAPVTITAPSGFIVAKSISLGVILAHARGKSDPVVAYVGPRDLPHGFAPIYRFEITFENGDKATGLTYDWRSIIDWLARGARRKNGAFQRLVLDPATPAEMVERFLDRRGEKS